MPSIINLLDHGTHLGYDQNENEIFELEGTKYKIVDQFNDKLMEHEYIVEIVL